MVISTPYVPWYADFANFIVCGMLPDDLSSHQKRKFLFDVKKYIYEMNLSFLESVLIILFGVVCRK